MTEFCFALLAVMGFPWNLLLLFLLHYECVANHTWQQVMVPMFCYSVLGTVLNVGLMLAKARKL